MKCGIYELGGLVKNADNKRVKKHLPTVVDATKEGAAKAIDMIREHKKGLFIVGGVLIVGGAVAGAATYLSQRDKIKAKKKFGETLEIYLNAAQKGTLTSNLVDELLVSIEVISKFSKDGAVPINLTSKQLYPLFNSIYDFTNRITVVLRLFSSRYCQSSDRPVRACGHNPGQKDRIRRDYVHKRAKRKGTCYL